LTRPFAIRLLSFAACFIIAGHSISLIQYGPISSWLLMNTPMNESYGKIIESSVIGLFLGTALWIMFKPDNIYAYIGLTSLIMLHTIVLHQVGGTHFESLTPIAHSLRILFPMACIGFLSQKYVTVEWLLRIGISITFATHGLECVLLHPIFTDYIISLSQMQWEQHTAEVFLRIIGIVDIVAALGILLPFLSNVFVVWTFLWGFATAFLRFWEYGVSNIGEFLIRSPHFLAPILLWYLWNNVLFKRKNPPAVGN